MRMKLLCTAIMLVVGLGAADLAIAGSANTNAGVTAPKSTLSTQRKKKSPSGVMSGAVHGGTAVVALTSQECTTLGGESVSESACTSGKACQTTTEGGDWKRVCLSKAK